MNNYGNQGNTGNTRQKNIKKKVNEQTLGNCDYSAHYFTKLCHVAEQNKYIKEAIICFHLMYLFAFVHVY